MVLFLPARFHLSPPRVLRFPAGSGVGNPERKPGDAIFKLSSSIHVSVLPLVMSYSALFRSISSMETGKHDRSGTEELFSGAARIPLVTVPYGMGLNDMEFQIHCIETEAYGAVLRAFIAQSDVLSWDKEGLISELRKELRVSDVEHREILAKADLDDSIKLIRKKRSATAIQPEPLSISMGPPHKKFKTAHTFLSSSPNFLTCMQPSPAALPSLTAHCRDNQLHDDTAVFSTRVNVGHGVESVTYNSQAPSLGKGITSLAVRPTINYPSPGIDGFKKGSGTIRLRLTDKLIHEVETIFTAENPDRAQIKEAKLILSEHERALVEALKRISDVSDGDDSHNEHYSYDEEQRNGRHGYHHALYGQADRKRGHFVQSLYSSH
ncbi:hypothetical protein AAC387_Pa07g2794 [Persea americana]